MGGGSGRREEWKRWERVQLHPLNPVVLRLKRSPCSTLAFKVAF